MCAAPRSPAIWALILGKANTKRDWVRRQSRQAAMSDSASTFSRLRDQSEEWLTRYRRLDNTC